MKNKTKFNYVQLVWHLVISIISLLLAWYFSIRYKLYEIHPEELLKISYSISILLIPITLFWGSFYEQYILADGISLHRKIANIIKTNCISFMFICTVIFIFKDKVYFFDFISKTVVILFFVTNIILEVLIDSRYFIKKMSVKTLKKN